MTLVTLDTATETLVVAAAHGDSWAAHYAHCGLRHASQLAPWIARVTAELGVTAADVDLIGVGIGPGSFTGVRIGLATAKGMAAAGNAQLVGICGLDALAYSRRHAAGLVVPLIDARKRRFYAACYRQGRRVTPYVDQGPGALAATVQASGHARRAGAADGAGRRAVRRQARGGGERGMGGRPRPARRGRPQPAGAHRPRRPTAAADVTPLYLRRSEAELGISRPEQAPPAE